MSVGEDKIIAEFYKLLVYDEGGFFLPHRDSEKSPGMFATLVVVLPAQHTGGELVIRHDGREISLPLTNDGFSEVSYAAFFADCEHEVKPVTSGNRVCLVFNLLRPLKEVLVPTKVEARRLARKQEEQRIQAKRQLSAGVPGGSPSTPELLAQVTERLRKELERENSPPKLVYMLSFHYTPAELSRENLKNKDRVVADALEQAAAACDCQISLGLVNIRAVFSIQMKAEEIVDFQGMKFKMQPLVIKGSEVFPKGRMYDVKADKINHFENTGNEGVVSERFYFMAAILIWKKSAVNAVIVQNRVSEVTAYIAQLHNREHGVRNPDIRAEVLAIVAAMEVFSFMEKGELAGLARLLADMGEKDSIKTLGLRLVDTSYISSAVEGAIPLLSYMENDVAIAFVQRLLDQLFSDEENPQVQLLPKLLNELQRSRHEVAPLLAKMVGQAAITRATVSRGFKTMWDCVTLLRDPELWGMLLDVVRSPAFDSKKDWYSLLRNSPPHSPREKSAAIASDPYLQYAWASLAEVVAGDLENTIATEPPAELRANCEMLKDLLEWIGTHSDDMVDPLIKRLTTLQTIYPQKR